MIDLRSDTVTKPTNKMREAMASAVVGDDVVGEDPTTKELEDRIARLFQKESGLFFPSGTMSNLSAILSWCNNRGSEIIVGDKSHIFLFEQSGAAQFGGISPRTVPNLPDGTMSLEDIRLAIRDEDIHEPTTKLICIENTHNVCGGKVIPISFLQELKVLADSQNIPIHLDGARIWNAAIASNQPLYEIGQYVDSISVCLSKGLGSPVGSVLVGTNPFITKARRIRKALGGGMRQSGILASAGLVSLDDYETTEFMQHDHRNTQILADKMRELSMFKLASKDEIHTNIIFAEITTAEPYNALYISSLLREKGILVSVWAPFLIRIVIHRDIRDADIQYVINTFNDISQIIQQ